MKYIVQHRRGTTAEWAEHSDIIPRNGEIVIEDCSNGRKRIYIGDGVTQFRNLHPLSNDDFINDKLDAKADISESGTVLSENADYAEILQWYDDNVSNANRIGYFVALDADTPGRTIKIANQNSDIIGVTVETPAFSGNAEDKFDANGNLLQKYEFVAVHGIVSIIDNGLCTVKGRCMPAADGTAIPSTNNMGYFCMERVDTTHMLIVVEPNADMIKRIKDDVVNITNSNCFSVVNGKLCITYNEE